MQNPYICCGKYSESKIVVMGVAMCKEQSKVEVDAANLSLRDVNARIREAVASGFRVHVKNARHIHGLAAGLRSGDIVVEGGAGDYLAMLNGGARVIVEGDVGDYVADGSWSGEVIVKGSAGYGASMYAYGGVLVVYGDAGDAVGQILKGATVIVNGNAGSSIGLYMVGGDIIVVGNAGRLVGDWMIRGCIYVGGMYESLGNNAKEVELTGEDVDKLSKLFDRYGVKADPLKFKKIVPVSLRPFYG